MHPNDIEHMPNIPCKSPHPEADLPGMHSQETLTWLADRYLNRQRRRMARGDIVPRSYADSRQFVELACQHIGPDVRVAALTPDCFDDLMDYVSDRWGIHRRGRFVIAIRGMFRWACSDDAGLIDRLPRYGDSFQPPEKRLYRRHNRERGRRDIPAETIRAMLRASAPQLRAMIYLGINCAFGNADCATLRNDAIDASERLIEWPRPKTEIARVCPLWPETFKAIERANCNGPLVFTSRYGRPWIVQYVTGGKVCSTDRVGREFRKLCERLGAQHGFYDLRRTFRTVADQTRDTPAVDLIMGHVDPSVGGGTYRQIIDPQRLRAVTYHVRNWLTGTPNRAARKRA